MSIHPRGLITDVVAPLRADLQFDFKGFGRLVERAAEDSAALLVNSVSGGEALDLPDDVRNEILILSMSILSGRKPLIAGVTGATPEATASNIEFVDSQARARDYPGEIFIMDAPLCYRGNRGMSGHYRALSGMTRNKFILLNDPAAAARARSNLRRHNIRTNIIKQLSSNSAITGMAHAGGISRSLNYARAARHRPDFALYDASELSFLNSPGSGGVISVGANIFPRAWRQNVESSFEEDESRKRSESYRLGLMREREELKQMCLAYEAFPPQLVKAALHEIGIIESDASFRPGDSSLPGRKEAIRGLCRGIAAELGEG